MFDGIKIQDLSVGADVLLTNDRLTFPLSLDERTGVVLTDRPRRADDQGLTFTLIPRLSGYGYRVEVKGSLHRYHNEGRHNADDFTVADLLTTLDQLLTTYGINPASTRLNNVEFGVNVRLSFPAADVLGNLVSYKNHPFTRAREEGDGYAYFQAQTTRYVVKLYDKGNPHGLGDNLLRVEVKVLRMEYLTRQSINLDTLADLLTVANYGRLGALLVKTFNDILFDDPAVDRANLTAKERSIYQNGRNPKFWHIPKGLTDQQAATLYQRLSRTERKYRALLDRYGAGNWQHQTATLIGQTWQRLTTTTDDLLTQIDHHRAHWQHLTQLTQPGEKCQELTRLTGPGADRETVGNHPEKCQELTDFSKPELSGINTLYVGLKPDISPTQSTPQNTDRGTVETGVVRCLVTGVPLSTENGAVRGRRRFISATMLRNNDDLLLMLQNQFKQYAKGSKENDYTRTAHNVRNRHSNERNNLRRRIERVNRQPTLFDTSEVLRLTPDQRAALDHWRGTPYEVRAKG